MRDTLVQQEEFHWIAILAVCVLALCVSDASGQWTTAPFAAPGPDERVQAMLMHDDGSGEAMYIAGYFVAIDGHTVNRIARYRNGEWSDISGGVESPGHRMKILAMIEFEGDLIVGGEFSSIGGVAAHGAARWDGLSWHAMSTLTIVDEVRTFTIFDGQLIAGGEIGFAQGVVRWDGTGWQPMGSLGDGVNALAVYNGELIAGGEFSGNKIARWTGSAWDWLGGGASGAVSALAVYNSELIITGAFQTVGGGVPANRIARWNGTKWSPLGSGLSGTGMALGVHDGRLYVGGNFTQAGAVDAGRIAIWDGVNWSVAAPGLENDLASIYVNAFLWPSAAKDSPLFVGGWFTTAGELCVNNIARLDGRRWSRLSECPTCQGLSGPVQAMIAYDDGSGESLYVGGSCRCAGTKRINRIARWDGTQWAELAAGVDGDARVYAVAEFDDGSGDGPMLYIGGAFTSVSGVAANNIAKWDGQAWHALADGVTGGPVYALQEFDDGSGPALYVGGRFTAANGQPATGIARWTGLQWQDFGGGLNTGGFVLDMLVWDDGDGPGLIVGGQFNTAAGQSIARWRSGAWSGIPAGGGIQGFVRSMAVFGIHPETTGTGKV